MPTLVHKVSRNDNRRSSRRIRQRGNAFKSHTRFPPELPPEQRLVVECLALNRLSR